MVRPTDPRYASQWHLELLGNIESVWDEYTGAGVTVGVFDDGIQYTHPDLNDNYNPALHFTHQGIVYDPTPITLTGDDPDGHGTSVAGIIAGEATNRLGGVGVSWGAKITGVNVLSDPRLEGDDIFPIVLRHAAVFDIMSNSWAFYPYFEDFQNLINPDASQHRLIEAYSDVAATGRDGLGTIIVQAAGNEALNASGDGLMNSRHIVGVSALYSNGSIADYSNFGPNILVSAGAASVTTDLMGANGYNKGKGAAGDYAVTFGGTSAATPVVSGVVALMLEANPDLGWRDVKEILATSARLTGALVTGQNGYEKGALQIQQVNFLQNGVVQRSGDTWNDGGRFHSETYGFGRVDAFTAVRLAEVWGLTHDAAQTSANELQVSYEDETPNTLVANSWGNYSWLNESFAITTPITIEYLSVTVDFTFTNSEASNRSLSIWLESPTHTRFQVYDGQPLSNVYDLRLTGGITWSFGFMLGLGLDVTGTWTLHVAEDGKKPMGHVGTLNSFSVDFYGAPKDVDDTHYITQDFLLAHKNDDTVLRDKVIGDTNGGTDWLNMAMLSGNVVASLVGGGKFSVNKVVWGSIAASAPIENMVTGDGNDSLTGNGGANEIHAMRGNDTVLGGGGDDKLHGGAGNDSLRGETGADRLLGEAGNDALNGGAGNDSLQGGAGNDALLGDLGDDRLEGGDGIDNLGGGAGADRLYGGNGGDKLYGDADADMLFGEVGNDQIFGGLGNDTVYGGIGNDTISEATGGGNDVVRGGDGRDLVDLGVGDDRFEDEAETGLAGSDTVFGGLGNDTLTGAGGNDSLMGDAGNDVISGGVGNDVLTGGAGLDRIEGGAGNDVLTGGQDADTFIFTAGCAADRVTDFRNNIDTLYFDDSLWGESALTVTQLVTGFARVVGSSVVFNFGEGDVVTLTSVRSLGLLYDDITLI
jgi:Ca2+-binding RTX toxin-like protein